MSLEYPPKPERRLVDVARDIRALARECRQAAKFYEVVHDKKNKRRARRADGFLWAASDALDDLSPYI